MTDATAEKDDLVELEPCPFCGGGAYLYENQVDFVPKWSVGCGDCNADMNSCEDTKQEAVAIWNTRAEPPQLASMRTALEEIVRRDRMYCHADGVKIGDQDGCMARIARAALNASPGSADLQSWWCDQCCVEVYQVRCPHCGKTQRERKIAALNASRGSAGGSGAAADRRRTQYDDGSIARFRRED